MPPDPLAARPFGARNLPRLVLKSGYGPDISNFEELKFELDEIMSISDEY